MTQDELNAMRKACLDNAEAFLDAADKLDIKAEGHVAYHLATLALEEVGKASMISMRFIAGQKPEPERGMSFDIDDHEKKLFWSLWGASFGTELLTKEQVESYRNLASTIHAKRLESLYVDTSRPADPLGQFRDGEVENILQLARARLGIERANGEVDVNNPDLDGAEIKDLEWFLKATDDPREKQFITSGQSNAKLVEFKGDAKKWVKWLHQQSQAREAEVKKLLEDELSRSKPSGKEALEPKWSMKIKIVAESHSVRPKPLVNWNEGVNNIKLHATKNKNELIVELIMGKAVPIKGVWDFGRGLYTAFITALNIASQGLFWRNFPQDISKYYDELRDLEKNEMVGVEAKPELKIDWKSAKLVLDDKTLSQTAMVFYYLSTIRGKKQGAPLQRYVTALNVLAKIDLNLRVEGQALSEFYGSLKDAMLANGDLNGKDDHWEAFCRIFPEAADSESTKKCFELGRELEASEEASRPITLTEVIAMKMTCDVYFFVKAKQAAEKRKAQENKDTGKKK